MRTRLLTIAALIVLNVSVWASVGNASAEMTVTFFDVGQGDAALVESGGRRVLIDAGPDDRILKLLSESMPFYDRKIDAIIETHGDSDHAGGLPAVMSRFEVGALIRPEVSDVGSYALAAEEIANERNVPIFAAVRGGNLIVGNRGRSVNHIS